MYHRIAEETCDPYGLCVSPSHFRQHLVAARDAGFRFVTLSELQARARWGAMPGRTLAVTFDDGYLDNMTAGWPVLRELGIPATMFIPSGPIGGRAEFWWDALDRVFLRPGRLPARLNLRLDGLELDLALDGAETYGEEEFRDRYGGRLGTPTPGRRQAAMAEVYAHLAPRPPEVQARAAAALLTWAELGPVPRATHRTMTAEELGRLAEDPLIEIGAHTVGHPRLSDQSAERQRHELRQGRADLETLLKRPVRGVAFPHGAFNATTLREAAEAGYTYACTVDHRPLRLHERMLCLPRLTVVDQDGRSFANALLGAIQPERPWTTLARRIRSRAAGSQGSEKLSPPERRFSAASRARAMLGRGSREQAPPSGRGKQGRPSGS
jgi:peptidoglycan/xylan/chitin deacetylase (PgdA/CDA1 family)